MLVRRIGIDFGTSTTVFAYKDYDKKGNASNDVPKLLELGGRVMFPTIVFEPENGDARVYGFDAEEESRITEGTLYTNFKMDLVSEEKKKKACELIGGYLHYLRNIYKEECSRIGSPDEEEVWLSYPAAWSEEVQMDMRQLAEKAGFCNVHVQDEPTAAINSVLFQCKEQIREYRLFEAGETKNVLMIDMGAGTTDLVVCRFALGEKKPVERLFSWPPMESGDYFGGREIDDILTEYCICYCENHNYFSRNFRKLKSRISRNIKKWKEGEFSRALQTKRKAPVPEIIESNVPDADERKDFRIVDRESFERELQDLLGTFLKIIEDCARELKNREDGFDLFAETDLVVLTGGNSAWYFIDEYLFGLRKGSSGFAKLKEQPGRLLRMGQPQQTVAYGLTLNEKMLLTVSETLKLQGVLEKKKQKETTIVYQKLKDLEPVVQLVNEAAAAIGDETLRIEDSPVANAVYLAGRGAGIAGVVGTAGAVTSAVAMSGTLLGGAALAGTFALAAPAAILGIGGTVLAGKVKKKQLKGEKERLLAEVRKHKQQIQKKREEESEAAEERKKLLDALYAGLEQTETELVNDLNAKK